jgi:hypothetical protein
MQAKRRSGRSHPEESRTTGGLPRLARRRILDLVSGRGPETSQQSLERLQKEERARQASIPELNAPPAAAVPQRHISLWSLAAGGGRVAAGLIAVAITVVVVGGLAGQAAVVRSVQAEVKQSNYQISCSYYAGLWRADHPGVWNGIRIELTKLLCNNTPPSDDDDGGGA